MEISLINKDSLILGPIGFNVRMINYELDQLELNDQITPKSYEQLPIHFSDGETHLLPLERHIPEHDPKYYDIGNFTWEIIKENNIPVKVLFTYPIFDKKIEELKAIRKQEVSLVRKEKENTIITVDVNNTQINVSTSREERILLATKLSSSPGPYNYKFLNTWLEITSEELHYILNEIDNVVQSVFDWELLKFSEIDSCKTLDEVYDVIIKENNPHLLEY